MEDDFDEILDVIHTSYAQKHDKYGKLQVALQTKPNFNVQDIKKLFSVTTKDLLKANLKYSKVILEMWLHILEDFELDEFHLKTLHQALVDSVVTNMKLLNKVAPINVHDELKDLSFEVMKLYPKEIIVTVAMEYRPQLFSLITSILNSKCSVSIADPTSFFENGDLKIGIMIFEILKLSISALPPDIRQEFIEKGLHVWFSIIIPFAISLMVCDKLTSHPIFAEVLDMLTNELDDIDCQNNREWKKILGSICRTSGYPELMMTSLKNKSDNWSVMWCVIVKLFKNQITSEVSGHEMPLNCILPVVENAFKMDAENRCRAFHCWQVLATYFASEKYDQKRIAFLMVPLLTNNAKLEDVALAKFQCWWHIIKCFQMKLNMCKYSLLIKFLKFCLRPEVSVSQKDSKNAKNPQFKSVTALGIEAFLSVVGHAPDCEGCIQTTIQELDDKILNIEILTANLSDWLIYIKAATIILVTSENQLEAKKQVVCIWHSFFNVMLGDVNENELTCLFLKKSLEIVLEHENTTEYIFHAICSVFFSNNKVAEQLIGDINARTVLNGPISVIIKLITHPHCYNYIASHEITPLMDPILEFAVKPDPEAIFLKHLLLNLPGHAQASIIWEALVTYIYENNANVSCFIDVLKWPFKKSAEFLDESRAASNWEKLYNYAKLNDSNEMKDFDKDLISLLPSYDNCKLFSIRTLCTLIKSGDENLLSREMELLHEKLGAENKLQSVIPIFNNCLSSILNKLGKNNKFITAKYTMGSINIVLKSMLGENFIANGEDLMMNLLINISTLMNNKNYGQFSSLIAETITKITMSKVSESCIKMAQGILEAIVKDIISDDDNEITEIGAESRKSVECLNKMKTPQSKDANKVIQNKENSSDCLFKVIVENGEDVLVVESKKKLNPQKLTEHQKEILQRKRDDIPALYQDLSQSQDEFKNKYWPTYNKIDNSIIKENRNISKEPENNAKNNSKELLKTEKKSVPVPTMTPPANKKRLPFKERIMLNIKNLQHEQDAKKIDVNAITEDKVTTPNKPVQIKSDVVNSAPASLNSFRSSRIRRKPLKYEQDFDSTARKRQNANDNQDNSDLKKKRIDEKEDTDSNNDVAQCKINNETNDKIKKIETFTQSIQTDDGEGSESVEMNDTPDINEGKELIVLVEHITDISTPKSQRVETKSKSTSKKEQKTKQSRLVKILAIDMENATLDRSINPRRTRQIDSKRRVVDSKLQSKLEMKVSKVRKRDKLYRNDDKMETTSESSNTSNDLPLSEDFIESSQESTFSIMTNKTRTFKKQISSDILASEDLVTDVSKSIIPSNHTDNIVMDTISLVDEHSEPNVKSTDDKEESNNGTALMDTQSLIETQSLTEVSIKSNSISNDLTASIDTEPLLSGDQVLVSSGSGPIINLNSPDESIIGPETMELAEADTEPVEASITDDSKPAVDVKDSDATVTLNEDDIHATDITDTSTNGLSSPFKDEHKRNEVFLNNTLNISPIQTMISSCDEEKLTEEPQDFVVIKLSSPVQSNGEPIYECNSPEIFTNDKISPSKDEESPTKVIVPAANNSPSLSLKKNRTQVRPTGRAAQMLSLCQADKLHSITTTEKVIEENKKVQAKRNLQILYNLNFDNSTKESHDSMSNEKMDSFLKLKRPLPADSSPIVPILKRKLEIDDDVSISPASKKKRVSFHDPPVSTTVAVQKYIEAGGERSPTSKRERPQRNNLKSPRQLETIFKFSPLTKAIENSSDTEVTTIDEENNCKSSTPIDESSTLKVTDDSTTSDIELTPPVEVINVQELNDKDPICPELIDCTELIDNIAYDLSSPSMKSLLVKELEGKVNTIGDLAKLTELEVNRLCIKAPKLETAKKALSDYLASSPQKTDLNLHKENDDIKKLSSSKSFTDAEVQSTIATNVRDVQTDEIIVADVLVQTKESSFMTTDEVIQSSIKNRPDFIDKVHQTKEIMNTLSLASILNLLQTKLTADPDRTLVLDRTLPQENGINFIQKYLCNKFKPAEIVILCSELLKSIHVKMDG